MKKYIKKIYNILFSKLFKDYSYELELAVGNSKTLLDIGCGSNSPIKSFSHKLKSVGVDGFTPSIEKSKKLGIHNDYLQMNVLEIGEIIPAGSYDCVLASDLVEHFTKEEGLAFIKAMETIAREKIVIFTPNGFLPQGEYDENPFNCINPAGVLKRCKKWATK